jgi:small subunit ribosomal protein S6
LAVAPDQRDEYELVLMLDPEAPDERRDEITANARQRIEGKGELKDARAWGMRKLAYEIRQRTEADYRFFRFQTDSPLLDELNHNLKITDGVLRFRIFKVDPRSPVIEPPPPVALAGASTRAPGPRRSQAGAPPAADAPAPEPQAPVAEEAPEPPAAPEEAPPAVEEPVEQPAEAPAEAESADER